MKLFTSLLLATAAAMPALAADLRVSVVDVEGGSAFLYLTPEGKSLLVDTGWPTGRGGPPGETPTDTSADRIAAAAKAMGITKLDYLLITHYHTDHVGGLDNLLAKLPVDTFLDHGENREALPAGVDPTSPRGQGASAVLYPHYAEVAAKHKRISPKAGDTLKIGSMTLRFVTSDGEVAPPPGRTTPPPGCDNFPDKEADGGIENAKSLGFVASYGKARIMSLGDDTWNIEKKLVCPINRIGPIDLLFVSHHGSSLSGSPQLFAAAAPRVAIVNNGPRKGGDAVVLEAVRATASHPALWQSHTSLAAPTSGASEARIANLATPQDGAYRLDVTVSPDATIRVSNPRTGQTESYPAKR